MIIPAGFAQVNCRFTGAAVPNGAEITFGVEAGAASASDVADDVFTSLSSSNLQSSWVANCILSSILVKLGPNDTGPSHVRATSLNGAWAATDAGAVAPAVLIRKSTALGGRRGRGRFFLPGVPESVISAGGTYGGTYVTDTQGRATALLVALTANNVPMVLLHGDSSTVPTPVTALAVQPVLGTQRRRQRR